MCPVGSAVSVVDCVNAGLAIPKPWRRYARSWPSYHIYEHATGRRGEWIAVVGHTTGSHLELPDEEEEKLTLIWVADVVDGLVHTWRLEPDTIERRAWYGIS